MSYGLNPDNAIHPLANMMDLISNRQQVIGHNIANVHTPGYTAQELSFQEVLARNNNPFETRLSKQFGLGSPEQSITGTGQPVNLHEQFLTMQENLLYFNMTSRRLTTIFNTLRTAGQIGR